ncbi:alpha/beta hydrolase [Cellulomonas fimi]|uniref:alpha/beta hydrolase n=1 Tax=Cellulomonas fimi TaxID=1708 RepID=UPI00234DF058|nr:alpha/beta hydrolase [Cellulomonas fimi]MDC7120847.1 alpha/beta hydrolase [Cellulomonas fimi]
MSTSQGRIGRVVALSSAVGLAAAALLVVAPFTAPTEAAVTGAVLCGLAAGWALLAAVSTRFTDQPQRWAVTLAVFMGLSGLLLLVAPAALEPLSWVWPPVLLVLVVRAFVHIPRDMPSRAGRWLLRPILAVLALAAVGGGYQTVQAALDASRPVPGHLISVGEHRLHLSCAGSGNPTVVLEPGAGMVAAQLELVAPVIAEQTRVCVYDRAGRGWSEPATTGQDAEQIATDLHTLLEEGGVPGPYVLAGHSFGGLYALTFAARYPDDVAGMVLVDTTPPAPAPDSPNTAAHQEGSADLGDRLVVLTSTAARLGVTRLLDQPTAASVRSTLEEYVQGSTSARQAAALGDFADRPLIVLTAAFGRDAEDAAAHDVLAGLSTNSAHRVVRGADHGGMITDPTGAAATSQAALDVVTSLRTGQTLTP